MTRQEVMETAGYFANPIRNSRIEIEAKGSVITNYSARYLAATGLTLPINSDFVYTLPEDADKWGREMRLYFTCTNTGTVPNALNSVMTVGGRPGYNLWDQRLNSKAVIDVLLTIGFRLGDPQDAVRIRSQIPAAELGDFDRGFNAL